MSKSIELGPAAEISVNDSKIYNLEAIDVAVYNIDGRYYAIGVNCPHAGVVITKGFVDGSIIICPGHGYKFDIITGKCMDNPELRLAKFNLKVSDGILFVTF
ncbi:MAG: Rieske 2Fe-2S domain-containing protein [candidate division Zixibacteria bacterium]